MAKHTNDPVLAHLVHAINESALAEEPVQPARESGVPVTVSANGMVLTGMLIGQDAYFAELVEKNPPLGALQPTSGLLGKEYARDIAGEADHTLHLRGRGTDGDDEPGLWRISLESVDAWTLRWPTAAAEDEDKGPFARLLGA